MGIQEKDDPYVIPQIFLLHGFNNIAQNIISDDNLNKYHIHIFTEKKHVKM